jgi:hypothetical protein
MLNETGVPVAQYLKMSTEHQQYSIDNQGIDNHSTYPNGGGPGGTTGRVDPPWVLTEGWQGFSGQTPGPYERPRRFTQSASPQYTASGIRKLVGRGNDSVVLARNCAPTDFPPPAPSAGPPASYITCTPVCL